MGYLLRWAALTALLQGIAWWAGGGLCPLQAQLGARAPDLVR
ncbi:MAG: hypothetical protein ACRD0K_09465 [Egibacteraceae bacterium]